MVHLFQRITGAAVFHRFILLLIIISGVLVGLESYPDFDDSTSAGRLLIQIQDVILWIFVLEIAMKIAACGARPWRYFQQPWNVFDFVIIGICFLPLDAQYATVFRMARVVRTLRMVTLLPRLQVLIGALLKSIPSLGYVGILLALHFYMYAVTGTFLFRENDPVRFGSLQNSTLTLFQVLTLEGWNDIFGTAYHGSDFTYDDSWRALAGASRVSQAQPLVASIYFISFIMLGTMIMLNLFTGVIIGSMEEATNEAAEDTRQRHLRERGFLTLHDEMSLISQRLHEISGQLNALRDRLSDTDLPQDERHLAAGDASDPQSFHRETERV